MFGTAPASEITGVPGWETAAEQQALIDLAFNVPDKGVIVEIGGEFGMSASLFAYGAKPDVTIVTVDLFPDDLQMKHIANLVAAGFPNRTIPIKGSSLEIGSQWFEIAPGQNSGIDLLFIDGDHNYNGAMTDIKTWIPFVNEGGIVVFHDATPPTNLTPHPLHHEVNRAIEDWLSEKSDGDIWKELPPVDTMRVFKLVTDTREPSPDHAPDTTTNDLVDNTAPPPVLKSVIGKKGSTAKVKKS